jgi:hypothetical protein
VTRKYFRATRKYFQVTRKYFREDYRSPLPPVRLPQGMKSYAGMNLRFLRRLPLLFLHFLTRRPRTVLTQAYYKSRLADRLIRRKQSDFICRHIFLPYICKKYRECCNKTETITSYEYRFNENKLR